MKHGAVASGHQITTETAMSVLREGGTAVDAAIAAYAAACVAEPCMASMGAGGFATVFADGQTTCIDFFCQTPAVKSDGAMLQPIHVDFGTAKEVYYGGPGAMAVPGIVRGIFDMHTRYGKLSLTDLFQPARQLAVDGVPLTPFQHLDLGLLRSIFNLEARGREIFFKGSELVSIGDIIRLEYLADFLDALAREGQDLFYRGEIAMAIEKISLDRGGHLTRSDLESYATRWSDPVILTRNGFDLAMPPGPSMGHAMLKTFDAAVDLTRFKGRPFSNDHLEILLPGLTSCKELLEYRALLFKLAGVTDTDAGKMTGTSHINVIDKTGMGIAMTFSIGEGSGIFINGTDIHMNNMLGEPSLLPDGLNSWPPDRRLASMMTPLVVTKRSELKYLLGTGGAERIPVMLALVIHYLVDQGLSLEEAIMAPRAYYSSEQLEVEVGFEHERIMERLPTRYWKEQSLYFGGVHGVCVDGQDITATGDARREGYAMVI